MRRNRLIIASICLSFLKIAYAIPDNESIPEYNASSLFKTTGYIDGSYNYLLRSNNFISKILNRENDVQENGFTLQQATLNLTKEPDSGWGGVASLVTGRDAFGLEINGMDPNAFGVHHFGFAVPQAYLRYKIHSETIKFLIMQSLAGYEQFDYTQDTNFSRSILDGFAQPGTHFGLRLLHEVNERLSLVAGVGNGWNTFKQPYHLSAFELGLNYAVKDKYSFMINTYSGYQYLTDILSSGPTYWRNVIDFFGDINVTKKLTLAVNLDYGVQTRTALNNGVIIGRAVWQGVAGYVNYTFNDKWSTSLRGEIFNDSDGYRTGVKQNWREITFSLAYAVLKDLQIRGETRHDFSNVNAYLNKSGDKTSNNQQSYALDVLFQF